MGFYGTPGFASGVAVVGGYAYVVDGFGLRVVDVSTPSAPAEVGFYDTPGDAYGVAVAGGYAYVAAYDAGLRVVDVSTPSNPTEVGIAAGIAQGVAAVVDRPPSLVDTGCSPCPAPKLFTRRPGGSKPKRK